MPCYNSVKYISESIQSVINQTFHDWELLVVDDCSTDGTGLIVKQFSKLDPRIRYLQTSFNSGSPGAPRNIALENAKGDYIAFLDSDDLWLPNKLEEQILYIQSTGHLFIYSNYEKISASGVRSSRVLKMKLHSSYKDILKSNEIPCLTVMLEKSLISNLKFDVKRHDPRDDYKMWLKILSTRCDYAYNTNKVHALYRDHMGSISSNKLKMILYQWFVLRRNEELNYITSLFYLSVFIVKGFMKYIK